MNGCEVKLHRRILHMNRAFMMTSSNGNIFRVAGSLCGISPVTGEFRSQRPMTQSFDVFFDLRLKNDWTQNWDAGDLRHSLWRHCNVVAFRCSLIPANFTHILPGRCNVTEAIIRLPQYHGSNPGGYVSRGSQHNHNTTTHNKTGCLYFMGYTVEVLTCLHS